MKKVLFINAAFRDDSRTKVLADAYLKRYDFIETVELGTLKPEPLNAVSLQIYNAAVSDHSFDDPMFLPAKQFAGADEIIIAAPFWNFSIPAILHDYIELVCTQGISFDVDADGNYYSLCKAKKLVYITTAGGMIPEQDHAFGYIRFLAEKFWGIDEIQYYKADGLDIWGADVKAKLDNVIQMMKEV